MKVRRFKRRSKKPLPFTFRLLKQSDEILADMLKNMDRHTKESWRRVMDKNTTIWVGRPKSYFHQLTTQDLK